MPDARHPLVGPQVRAACNAGARQAPAPGRRGRPKASSASAAKAPGRQNSRPEAGALGCRLTMSGLLCTSAHDSRNGTPSMPMGSAWLFLKASVSWVRHSVDSCSAARAGRVGWGGQGMDIGNASKHSEGRGTCAQHSTAGPTTRERALRHRAASCATGGTKGMVSSLPHCPPTNCVGGPAL